ncbi:MAG: histidinol dehydrogenase [Thermoleophilia bacterium]|nr:histidinol dehydrogenase [Thermoleophilia bacterium]
MSEVRHVRLRAGGTSVLAQTLRPPWEDPDVADSVRDTIHRVRERGDAALVDDAVRFGAPDFTPERIRVPKIDLETAARGIDPALREAITTAATQVRSVAEALVPTNKSVAPPAGQMITVRSVPVDAAGCYVPGGRAAYPSSLIMTAVPAQVAGVDRVVVASPPGANNRPSDVILATAYLLGVTEVYAVGGAGAVAALAYGTASIRPVAVITGPGSPWVQEAKRQVTSVVGIDGFAGPSEVMIIADATADPRVLALDLLAQAEHGPDSSAVFASDDPELVGAVDEALGELGPPVGAVTLVEAGSMHLALELAEAFAPEHLQIWARNAREMAMRVRRAGAVFVGRNCATAFGDYVAGSNHVLPTGGAARFASALGPSTYLRRMSIVDIGDDAAEVLAPSLVALAEAEGFPLHAESVRARVEGRP